MDRQHIDFLTELGPGGIRTSAARSHVARCAECQRRVTAMLRLAELAVRGAQALPGKAHPSPSALVRVACDPAGELRARRHVQGCHACSAAVEEARRAVAKAGKRLGAKPVRVVPLPPALRVKIAALREAVPPVEVPLAAIPRDITRPSSSPRSTGSQPTPKKRTPR